MSMRTYPPQHSFLNPILIKFTEARRPNRNHKSLPAPKRAATTIHASMLKWYRIYCRVKLHGSIKNTRCLSIHHRKSIRNSSNWCAVWTINICHVYHRSALLYQVRTQVYEKKVTNKMLTTLPSSFIPPPEDYPFSSPTCSLNEHDYSATPFLNNIQQALMARVCKLPKLFSLSHLLDTWEMSVRQACSPTLLGSSPTEISVLLGI